MKFSAILVCLAQVASCTVSKSSRSLGQNVQTSSGTVSGHVANNETQVSEYLGIPYAKPPVGDLRFAPPQPLNEIASTAVNGTNFGYSCATITAFQAGGGTTGSFNIQGANLTTAGLGVLLVLGQIGDTFSEDCLTLNVWVPSGGEEKKAVLLWIHGGGFTSGTSHTATYNGQHLAAEQDIIVVSINYRLNIFGFSSNPALPDRNVGLLDQRVAIEWVRDNIKAFGGDTSRITLFGQSAGSASLDFYSYAYASDPIVSGMIFESGTIGFGVGTPADASKGWFNVTSTLGCGDASSNGTAVTACMRSKNFTSVLDAMGSNTFNPSVDNITVFSDYDARAKSGNFTKVPVLIGNADYEAGLFATQAALSNRTYPRSYWDAFNLNSFTCPAGLRANVSISVGVPTWRYRWFGAFPDTRLTTVPDSGAWHASELPVVFNNLPNGTGIPEPTTEELAIGTYLRGAWATFAKDPVSGLNKYGGGWPQYQPLANTLIRLAYNNLTGTNLAMPAQYDLDCGSIFEVNGTNGTNAKGNASSTSASLTSSATAAVSSQTSKLSEASGLMAKAWGSIFLSAVTLLAVSIGSCFM